MWFWLGILRIEIVENDGNLCGTLEIGWSEMWKNPAIMSPKNTIYGISPRNG